MGKKTMAGRSVPVFMELLLWHSIRHSVHLNSFNSHSYYFHIRQENIETWSNLLQSQNTANGKTRLQVHLCTPRSRLLPLPFTRLNTVLHDLLDNKHPQHPCFLLIWPKFNLQQDSVAVFMLFGLFLSARIYFNVLNYVYDSTCLYKAIQQAQ